MAAHWVYLSGRRVRVSALGVLGRQAGRHEQRGGVFAPPLGMTVSGPGVVGSMMVVGEVGESRVLVARTSPTSCRQGGGVAEATVGAPVRELSPVALECSATVQARIVFILWTTWCRVSRLIYCLYVSSSVG